MVTPAHIIAADVAARYGVAVCPSVVQLCPPMTCTASTPIWDEKIRQLVYPDHAARKVALKKAIWAGAARARASAVDPAIAVRRDDVRQWHGHGLSVRQIAERLGIGYDLCLKDHRICGLPPNAYVTSAMTQSAVRAARVRDLHAEGWTVKRIAALLGIGDDTVRDLAWKHYGLKFARKVAKARVKVARVARPPKPPVVKVAKVAVVAPSRPPKPAKPVVVRLADLQAAQHARRLQLPGLIAQGRTLKSIAAEFGVSERQIRRDCRDAGITHIRPGRWREKRAVAA